jgi:TolB protein
MTKRILLLAIAFLGAAVAIHAGQIKGQIEKGTGMAAIAVPDLRGSGDAQARMATFNQTLWSDLQASGLLKMVSKSLYPLQVPRAPQDFRPPSPINGRPSSMPSGSGLWLTDWSGPPVNANYLAFGYTGVENGQLVLRGWLYNVTQNDLQNAQALGKIYLGTPDDNGARKVAHEFAADILGQFGGVSLAGTKIYFISDRTGHKEIWSMDYDGSNQKQRTSYKDTSITPAVSADGSKIAFTTYAHQYPAITVISTETWRRLQFYNPVASMNAMPEFAPDGKHILFSSTVTGFAQLYIANLDGGGLRRLAVSRALDVEPKVNPKTGAEIVFVSDRGGHPQIYRMNMDGADVQRLTEGSGDAVNPAWNPDGQHIAFSWTRGYEPGNFNIFIMDVAANKEPLQLTHGAGRNEHPRWAPDGTHLVFDTTRSGKEQIWTMLADGTQLKQLTTQGQNTAPVWGK